MPVFFCFSIRDLLKFKEEVTKERDQLLSEVVKLRESLAQTTEQQQETERCREVAEQAISQVGLPCRRGGGTVPADVLSVLVPLLNLPTGAPKKHPLFCLFLWFVWQKQFYLCRSSQRAVWKVTEAENCLQLCWRRRVPCEGQGDLLLAEWFPWPFSFVRKLSSWTLLNTFM